MTQHNFVTLQVVNTSEIETLTTSKRYISKLDTTLYLATCVLSTRNSLTALLTLRTVVSGSYSSWKAKLHITNTANELETDTTIRACCCCPIVALANIPIITFKLRNHAVSSMFLFTANLYHFS